jgi:O-antigen/teichoic acid export membrane protein
LGDNSLHTEIEEAAAARGLHAVRRWRDRQALKTAGAGLVVQALSYAVRLAVIPLSLKLLGTERYGLWLAAGSLIAWGGIADLGFSPGLVNVVARASGYEDRAAMRRHVSTAFAAYAVLAAILALAVLAVLQWPGLPGLLGARNPALAKEARLLVAVCGLVFAASMLARVIPTACTALQEGYLGAWAYLAGSLVSLLLLLPLVWSGGSLFTYAVVMSIPALAAQAGLGLYLFGWRRPDLRPALQFCDKSSLRALWGFGGPLTLHQAANLAVLYTANILIANRLGAAAVPQYAVPYALFMILTSTAWLVVSPYLPAYAEAAARGDWHWIRRRAIAAHAVTAVLLGGGGTVLVLLGPAAIRLWAGRNIQPSTALLVGLAGFCLLKAISNANGVLLTGLGLVKLLAGLYLTVAALYVVGAWFLLPRLGLLAIPLAGAAAHLLDAGISFPCALRHIRSQDRRRMWA